MLFLFVVPLLFLPSHAEKCVKFHKWNEKTGNCEWAGPKDACAGLMDFHNRTWFMPLLNFPNEQFREMCLKTTGNQMDDYVRATDGLTTVRVVVRRGCMFTGYAHEISGTAWQEVKLVENLLYGMHDVPNYMNALPVRKVNLWEGGLTRALCFCDPTEATVNGHVPAPPPDKKCIEHHEFNETTQQCEWTKDPKFCAKISTHENLKMMLEIPKWPENRKYDVEHVSTLKHLSPNFDYRVTGIIVRQHCFATLYWRWFHDHKTLPTAGYGNILSHLPLMDWEIQEFIKALQDSHANVFAES